MEFLPDNLLVRLQSRARETSYLHADEDVIGIFLRPHCASANAEWEVQQV